jgi:hypothetical protein
VLVQADSVQTRRESWLGFWFGANTSVSRRVVGAGLLVLGALLAIGLAVNPDRVDWLSWRAKGAEAALSLVVVAVLFLLPVATNLKVAGVEITVSAAPEPVLDPIDPVTISRMLEEAIVNLFAAGPAGLSTTAVLAGSLLPSDSAMAPGWLPAREARSVPTEVAGIGLAVPAPQ